MLAGKIGEVRRLVLAGDSSWPGPLRKALAELEPPHGDDPLLGWLAGNPDSALPALQALWEDGPAPDARMKAFWVISPLPPWDLPGKSCRRPPGCWRGRTRPCSAGRGQHRPEGVAASRVGAGRRNPYRAADV